MMALKGSQHTLMIRKKICATRTLLINRTSYIVHKRRFAAYGSRTSRSHLLRTLRATRANIAIVHRTSYMGRPRLPPSYMANAFPNAFALAVVPLSVTRCFCSRNSHVFTGAFFFLPAPSSNVTPAYLPPDLPDLLS